MRTESRATSVSPSGKSSPPWRVVGAVIVSFLLGMSLVIVVYNHTLVVGSPTEPALHLVAGPEVPVSWSLLGANAEVEEAVDPATHYLYVLWIASAGIGFARSTDGGASFGSALILPGSEDFANSTTFATSWDPAITTNTSGTIYAAFMHSNSTALPGGAPFLDVSTNHGSSFAFSSVVNSTGPYSFSDREFVAVASNGDVYVTWDYAPNRSEIRLVCSPIGSCGYSAGDLNLVFERSTDGGRTWSAMVHVSPSFPDGGADSGPLVVESNGKIDVLFQAYQTDSSTRGLHTGEEYFTSSTDAGTSWSTPVLVGNASYSMTDGEWWIDGNLALGSTGVLYATYDTQAPNGDTAWFSYSVDGGKSWASPTPVVRDPAGAAHIVQVVAGSGSAAYIGWISNDTQAHWAGYLAAFSLADQYITPPIVVSSYLGIGAVWPGDTIGLVYLGNGQISMAWGIGLNATGQPSDNIFNVISSTQ